ncbi:MAG: F0F1 ATP synthase subunit epsilon [Pseudomonadota bacterium]
MADKLQFSLVSPARELFSGEVEQVIAPGSEGQFGVLVNHAPFMTTLKNGVVTVKRGGSDDMRIFVRGGFADVTPAGLTVLAEEAVDLSDVTLESVDKDLQAAREDLLKHPEGDGKHALALEESDYLQALRDALAA